MIRAVLVDDEPPARRKLRHLLSSENDISVVGEAGCGAEAVEQLNHLQPDVAFLDIQLPDCTGFDVLEALEFRDKTHLVFVTAHDDYAVKAFDVSAVDYLLKPVEPSRFAKALSRIRRSLGTPSTHQIASQLDELMTVLRADPTYVRRLLIQDGSRSVFVEVNRIDWFESARNYVCVHCGDRTHILRASLESVHAKLDPALFRRISRSEIVNLDRVAEVRSWFHGDQKLILKSGQELNWSRRYRAVSTDELERA